jgi:hypothetical protein
VFVWTVLLVMPENPDKTSTAGRPTCVNNHINVSTDDMCHANCLAQRLCLWRYGAVKVQLIGRSPLLSSERSPTRVVSCRQDEKAE